MIVVHEAPSKETSTEQFSQPVAFLCRFLRFECLEMALQIHDQQPVDLSTLKPIIEDGLRNLESRGQHKEPKGWGSEESPGPKGYKNKVNSIFNQNHHRNHQWS